MSGVYALGKIAPQIAQSGVWVAPTAFVIGDVVLGRDTGVWFGAVLRGDNEPIIIGDETNLQEHAVLHTDIGFPLRVGHGCTVGHRALLHGCTVGNNTLIGMGAMIMNGAVIGDNCLIGANTLVTEGKTIPDGALVFGAPAQIKRTLNAEEIGGLRASAAHYVAQKNRMIAGLRPLAVPTP